MPTPDRPTPAPSAGGGRDALRAPDASLYLHPQTLSKLGSMELRAKMIVEGVMSGAHRSPYQGFSVEFAQHRPYTPGDDTRHLDWKVYGRTDKLHLKQYQQETNLDLVVMVDASGSMAYGSRPFAQASGQGKDTSPDGRLFWSKFDHATALAAALSYITLRQRDRVGLVVFADTVRAMVNRSGSQGQWRQIVSALTTQPVEAETDIGRSMDQMLAKVGSRCLIALVTDALFDPASLDAALARVRHRGHDLMLFQVLDRDETEFNFRSPAPFEGLEDEPLVRVDPRAIREGYLEAFRAHEQLVQRSVLRFGYDLSRVMTSDWLGPPLASYLAKRNARIKKSKYG